MPRLHVNIDHIATVRQARRGVNPDPVTAAALCELAGANGITVHLREDRRHIQDRDVNILSQTVKTTFNLEMALTEEMMEIAFAVQPDEVCIVPENRQELTTEGGLDAASLESELTAAIPKLQAAGILVSIFVDPDPDALEACAKAGADFVELHTGAYANADAQTRAEELVRLETAARYAHGLGLRVNAGHGLNYDNVQPIAALPFLEELNIGHAIISRATFIGLDQAVREMQDRILSAPEAEE